MESLTFLPETINFSTGDSFLRLKPITDFRQCHGTIPHESRILYRCRRVNSKSPPSPPAPSSKLKNDDKAHEEEGEGEEDFILKIKIQIPSPDSSSPPQNSPKNSPDHHHPTPSPPTLHEQHALSLFQQTKTPNVPHLLANQTTPQPSSSPFLPAEGYISYTVMTRLPGKSLFEIGYWSLEPEARDEIRREFLVVLRSVQALNIEPMDKGLRNVMWDASSRRCGLVDFEHWQAYTHNDPNASSNGDGEVDVKVQSDTDEELLQKWGLAHKPPARNWWAEFGIHTY